MKLSKEESSFLKKRTKKLFFNLGLDGFTASGPELGKFFCFFFFKKRSALLLLTLPLVLTACGRRGAPTPPGPASEIIYPHVYPAE